MRYGKIETQYGVIFKDGTEILTANFPYHNYGYPDLETMKQALDFLLDGDLEVVVQPLDPVERGQEVPYVDLHWSVKGSPSSQSIGGYLEGYEEIDSTLRSHRVYGPFTGNTTFIVRVEKEGQEVEGSTTLVFNNHLYWGAHDGETITPVEVLGLYNHTSATRELSMKVSGNGGYLYVAWPKRLGDAASVKINSMVSNAWVTDQVTITNTFGYSELYYIYRSLYRQNGTDILLEVN